MPNPPGRNPTGPEGLARQQTYRSGAEFELWSEGYEVYPVTDDVGGTSPEAYRAALERIVQAGVRGRQREIPLIAKWEYRNGHHQRYCSAPAYRQASKVAS
jgi:hypothetical protein